MKLQNLFFMAAVSIVALLPLNLNAQAPENDECASAIEFIVNGGVISASNSFTAADGPEPTCGGTGIKDVWYYFIYEGGTINIQTGLGTNTDTRIALYDNCGGNLISCNDDNGGYASLIVTGCPNLTVGETYYIQVGGYNAIAGTFTLNVTSTVTVGCTDPAALNYNSCATVDDGTCENAVAPVNDDCANAISLAIDGGSVLANNTLATSSGSNPTCGNSGTNQMKDMWYSFVATGSETDLNILLGTLTDSRIAVYDACDGNQLYCDDDSGPGLASYIHFACGDLLQGNTYYIRVGGYGALAGNFSIELVTTNTCVIGENCDVPFSAELGENMAPAPNSWYSFTPDLNGQYRITTCGLNTCDTKIWIYDYCTMANFDDSNAATYTYNDDFCGIQAEITPVLAGGYTYYLRVGDTNMACGDDTLYFNIEYMGPVAGCMDINACNYSAIAAIEAPCFYNDDPECDGIGPDLEIQGNEVYTTLYNTTITSNDACLVNEGCLQGIGTRDILRFSTHIKNIGNQDYFIGVPSATNGQFEWDECHNHYHYEGYAEYLLFDSEGNPMPQIGFKNGFCVLDLECSDGGVAKYGCGNMGITAGCGDIYNSGLACQWIDVTDVPGGDYFLVVRTNWDQSPDNAGHFEQRYDNNAVQVCIHFDRDANGALINFTKDISNCIPVTDCLNIPFGDNYPDCEGNCPGIIKKGDVISDALLTEEDVQHYVESTIDGSITVSTCTDLNGDGEITVTDAVMLEACIHGQIEQGIPANEVGDCPYDGEIINPNHTTTIGILTVDLSLGYVDVYVLNPDKEIKGLEFDLSGITIESVEALSDISGWDIELAYSSGGSRISVVGHEPTFMPKFSVETALFRIHYASITANEACISNIVDVVNLDNHNTLTVIGNCQSLLTPFFASFNAENTTVCAGDYVQFHNISIGDATSITWMFDSGIPSSSNDENPIVQYTTNGIYSVSLTITNGNNSSTSEEVGYITVLAQQTLYYDGDEDGYGDNANTILSCYETAGYTLNDGDCNDNNANIHPNAIGTSDGIDNNCNGTIDPDEINPNPSICLCDINQDGSSSVDDLLILINDFGCTTCPQSDLDNDAVVGSSDLIIFMGCFGVPCSN